MAWSRCADEQEFVKSYWKTVSYVVSIGAGDECEMINSRGYACRRACSSIAQPVMALILGSGGELKVGMLWRCRRVRYMASGRGKTTFCRLFFGEKYRLLQNLYNFF